jgi:hypothetical protein
MVPKSLVLAGVAVAALGYAPRYARLDCVPMRVLSSRPGSPGFTEYTVRSLDGTVSVFGSTGGVPCEVPGGPVHAPFRPGPVRG